MKPIALTPHLWKRLLSTGLIALQLALPTATFAEVAAAPPVATEIEAKVEAPPAAPLADAPAPEPAPAPAPTPAPAPVPPLQFTSLIMGPGQTQTERLLTWHQATATPANSQIVVQYILAKDLEGDNFPTDPAKITTVTPQTADITSGTLAGQTTYKAALANLEENGNYAYRLVNLAPENPQASKIVKFHIGASDVLKFAVFGDPQIGASAVETDSQSWKETLNAVVQKDLDLDLLLTVGDQVNTATSEAEYAGFLGHEAVAAMPTATLVGNHDNAVNYAQHFNLPNLNNQLGNTSKNPGGDYWYTYGNVQFLMLNTNNTSVAEHKAFMEQAIAAAPSAQWRIVSFHQSIYSSASHSVSSSIKNLRATLGPVIDQLKIDAVFSGHDHVYTRSYHMKGDLPILAQKVNKNGATVNPDGTLYITANSSTGSKYYNLQPVVEPYAAVRAQLQTPTTTIVTISKNGTAETLNLETYRIDNWSLTDSYTMTKDPNDTGAVPQPAKQLSKLTLTPAGTDAVLSLKPTGTHDAIAFKQEGFNQDNAPFAFDPAKVVYKFSKPGIIAVSGQTIVRDSSAVLEAETTVDLWAEIAVDSSKPEEILKSNVITVSLKDLKALELVAKDSKWRYEDSGSDLGAAWFGDTTKFATWKEGKAPLGYPAGDKNPTFGPVSGGTLVASKSKPNAMITYYFAQDFEVENVDQVLSLQGVMGFDDGYVLYVNGQEVHRKYMPEGPIDYMTFATFVNEPSDAEGTDQVDLTKAVKPLLKKGKNTIAVEVHNRDKNSSDIYWGMKLTALYAGAGSGGETPQPKAPLVALEMEKPTINTDVSNQISAYITTENAVTTDALKIQFKYDDKALVLKEVKTLNPDGFAVFKDKGGEVTIVAGYTRPLEIKEAQKAMELIFEVKASKVKAVTNIQITGAEATNAKTHAVMAATINASPASLTIINNTLIFDVNGDGQVNLSDLSTILKHYRRSNKDTDFASYKAYDLNGDGSIDTTDFTLMAVQILKGNN